MASPILSISTGSQFVSNNAINELITEHEPQKQIVNQQQLNSNKTSYNYVIITTKKIKEDSSKLDDFIQHKENIGYHVLVITEEDFNTVQGEPPNKRPEKIRQWLRNNYETLGIEYVLLIGDPCPDTYFFIGLLKQFNAKDYSIPMKIVREMQDGIIYSEYPTDLYYADLDDWNYNNNRWYGDTEDYEYMDLVPEVYVGRIPVYSSKLSYDYNITYLDNVFEKIIHYEEKQDTTWRKSVLLPMSFSRIGIEVGTRLAEQMLDDFFIPRNFSYWRMYQQGTDYRTEDSIYDSEEELFDDAVVNHWKDIPYGLVCWAGHGDAEGVGVGTNLHPAGTLFTSDQSLLLNDSRPAIVFMISCDNGFPENQYNLGYSLLQHGAIATISGSRMVAAAFNDTYGDYDTCGSATGIAYRFFNYTTRNYPLGKALCLVKAELYPGSVAEGGLYDIPWKKELFVLNLYGDPSLSLNI